MEIISQFGLLGLLALLVSAASTPLAMWAARKFDVMDHPDTFLKPHARATPYLGGTAIAAGWIAAQVAAVWVGKAAGAFVLPLLAGGVAITAIGVIDDARHIAPKLRLALCAAVILVVMSTSGIGLSLAGMLARELNLTLAREWAVGLSLAVGLFVVLGACNSTNLIDGLDGLCAGVMAIIGAAYFLLAAQLASSVDGTTGVRLVAAVAMAGAALGFLIWNYNPARIFMGDAGSLLLGFNSGMLMLAFGDAGDLRWFIAALLIFTLPVYDTILALFRRWRSGKPVFEGDRSHFYDQLVQRGFTVRQTGAICYAFTGACAGAGLIVPRLELRGGLLLFVGVWLGLAVFSFSAGFASPQPPEGKTAI